MTFLLLRILTLDPAECVVANLQEVHASQSRHTLEACFEQLVVLHHVPGPSFCLLHDILKRSAAKDLWLNKFEDTDRYSEQNLEALEEERVPNAQGGGDRQALCEPCDEPLGADRHQVHACGSKDPGDLRALSLQQYTQGTHVGAEEGHALRVVALDPKRLNRADEGPKCHLLLFQDSQQERCNEVQALAILHPRRMVRKS
mmetsp:Transcript_13700/g.34698  ORF Transcript_13700/g.34698 Transcript_13700/m.34698 type:complete len:201 (+) Transcript_13700:231-833(+)